MHFLNKIFSSISNLLTKIENSKFLSKLPKKVIRPVLLLVILAMLGAMIYYPVASLTTSTATATETLQTAVARRGDLVISSSGTGTLIAKDQVSLAFKTSGQVTAINFKVGDQVKVGDVIAQIDDTDAQIKLTQAKRALAELTSPSAIASAQQAQATAAQAVVRAQGTLEYLLSPEVYHWELEISKTDQLIKDIKNKLISSPSDTDLQAQLKKQQDYLDFAQSRLKSAKYTYEKEYVPKTFAVMRNGVRTLVEPSEAEILTARAAVSTAQASFVEAGYLYTYLTGGTIPSDATGAGITAIETAKLNLDSAQATLDGTRLVSTISGTIMTLTLNLGDTVGSSTVIATVADLSQPYLEVFFDAADWPNIKTGNDAEAIFDSLPDITYKGTVTQVDPGLSTQGNSSVIRVLVKLNLTPKDNFNLPLASTVGATVIGAQATNAVLIPIEALKQAGDKYTVFVQENGNLKLRVVQVGLQDLVSAEIKSGLNPGEVVSTGLTVTK